MRWLVAMVFVTACGFTRNGSQAIDSSPGTLDARPQGSDSGSATPDAFVPPDACVDVDGDGVCDDVDDWLCGPSPTPPGLTIMETRAGNDGTAMTITLSAIDVSTQGQLVSATPGADLAVGFHYVLDEDRCSGNCIDQIEIGYDMTGGRRGCGYDGTVNHVNGVTGTVTGFAMTAPTTPGMYRIATDVSQADSCAVTTEWWPDGTPPDPSWTIALLCVH